MYQFTNINGTTVDVWEWVTDFVFTEPVGLKLNHVGIIGPWE